ncbi:VPLPA-CTERM sorting domain-containing protein [Rubrimonas sp.]|uniref:VPLPA-CTERM sorting domain-containing protein n=1 Tax=Rubrimonas sp. TaxID=2036015 RepID=UPI002FDDD1BD
MRHSTELAALCVLAALGPLAAAAATVTEAGAHFFRAQNDLTAYEREIIDTTGSVNAASADADRGFSISARSRASVSSLGIELDTFGGGAVGASIFEGVQFISPQLPTAGSVLTGYSIAVVGRLTGAINQIPPGSVTPVPFGDPLLGFSQVQMTFFSDTRWRDQAVRDIPAPPGATQNLLRQTVAGPVSIPFAAPTPSSIISSGVIFPNYTRSAECQRARDEGRQCGVAFIGPSAGRFTSFGLGLALSGQLIDEFPAQGAIRAFNSFDLEGLAMIDPDGVILDGLFLTDSGVDLTLDAYRLDPRAPAPIPLPAGAFLLPAGLAALGLMARRKREVAAHDENRQR